MNRPAETALYRHFDAAGRLLYVGISNNALRRLLQHREKAHWFTLISRVDIQWLPSRRLALDAEAIAIIDEHPAWNKTSPKRVATQPRRRGNFAIEHTATGRRDGNYFDPADADMMLAFWREKFPEEQFCMISAPPTAPAGATDFRPTLRVKYII